MHPSDDLPEVSRVDAGLDSGIDRRSVIKKVAAGGAVAWAAPTVLGVHAAAQASHLEPGPDGGCPEGHVVRTFWVKWDPAEFPQPNPCGTEQLNPTRGPTPFGFVPAGTNQTPGNCLANDGDAPDRSATTCETEAFLAWVGFTATFVGEVTGCNDNKTPGDPTDDVTIYEVESVTVDLGHCTTTDIDILQKAGPDCIDELAPPEGQATFTVTKETPGNAISHIEFAVTCCAPESIFANC